ncbi:MAG: signal peptidase II [Rickettsiales bacterium]|nr:signal peptidase II [Rickettsiales bacterium]
MSIRSVVAGLGISLVVVAIDMLTKQWALDYFYSSEQGVVAVTPFLNWVLVWNRGVSFGLFASHNQPLILIGVSLFIIAIVFRWLMEAQSLWLAVALGAIIGGAVGNVIDRVRYGAVVDFIDVYWQGYHWPAFNIADSAIFIGVVVLCVETMLAETKHKP